MSNSKIEVFKCDRCDNVSEIRHFSQYNNWGKVAFSQANGPMHNVSVGVGTLVWDTLPDICPKCMLELNQ